MSSILENYENELIENLEDLLDDFFTDLVSQGLKSSTAERHTANADMFLVQYHAFHFLQGIETITPEKIYDFLGLWYFQRVFSPSRSDITSILGSLKKLFTFLQQQNRVTDETWGKIKPVLNDKHYFMERYEEYEANPPEYEEEGDISDEEMYDLVNSIMSVPPPEEEEEFEEDLSEEDDRPASLQEILNQLKAAIEPPDRQDNVISLESKLQIKSGTEPLVLTAEPHSPRTLESLKEQCLAMHQSNLIFIRWLDRFRCQPADLPPDAFGLCASCDSMLEYLLPILEGEVEDPKEIEYGHELLDIMDRMLWAARHRISQVMGLDLRLLPL